MKPYPNRNGSRTPTTRRNRLSRIGAGFAALLATLVLAGVPAGASTDTVDVPNSKDLAAQTIDLAGTIYQVTPETVMLGLFGERVRLRDIVTLADTEVYGGEPHELRFSASVNASGDWQLDALEIIGLGSQI